MTKEGSTQIVNFMTPGEGFLRKVVAICHFVKMHYSFKTLLLFSQTYIRQTKCIVMMTKEGCTKVVNCMTPKAEVLVLECGHISHILKMHYFFKILFYSHA